MLMTPLRESLETKQSGWSQTDSNMVLQSQTTGPSVRVISHQSCPLSNQSGAY